MGLFRKIIECRKTRLAEKYRENLLIGKIRLMDIPTWLRLDYRRCYPIYITAFRVDRGTSKERFKEDLSNLEVDIELAKAMHDSDLVQLLTRIHQLKIWDFEVFFPS